jgi:hypothetical protein
MYKKTNKRKNKIFRKNKTVKKGGRTKKQTKQDVIDKTGGRVPLNLLTFQTPIKIL